MFALFPDILTYDVHLCLASQCTLLPGLGRPGPTRSEPNPTPCDTRQLGRCYIATAWGGRVVATDFGGAQGGGQWMGQLETDIERSVIAGIPGRDIYSPEYHHHLPVQPS